MYTLFFFVELLCRCAFDLKLKPSHDIYLKEDFNNDFFVRCRYVAIGPVYETKSKEVKFGPTGLDKITQWRSLVPPDTPIIAIGGITLKVCVCVGFGVGTLIFLLVL